jgi:hypothetical protein
MFDLRMNHSQSIEPGDPCLQLFSISDLKAKMIQASRLHAKWRIGLWVVVLGQPEHPSGVVPHENALEGPAGKGTEATESEYVGVLALRALYVVDVGSDMVNSGYGGLGHLSSSASALNSMSMRMVSVAPMRAPP